MTLADTLSDHRVSDLDEAGDVGADDVVALLAVLRGGFPGVVVDGLHDALELLVDFLARPGETFGVLRHLKTGRGDATGVGSLARGVHDLRLDERLDRLRGGRHVGTFADERAAMLEEVGRILRVELVLTSAREGRVDLVDELPAVFLGDELDALRLDLGELAALDVLEVHDRLEEVLVDAVLDDDRTGVC